jgi:hypothetical protein
LKDFTKRGLSRNIENGWENKYIRKRDWEGGLRREILGENKGKRQEKEKRRESFR